MVSGVILGLFIIPVLFVIFQALQERITGVPLAVLNRETDGNDTEHLKQLEGELTV
jgi:HAE1 family hydrophobic/amphiphilic exporter-1